MEHHIQRIPETCVVFAASKLRLPGSTAMSREVSGTFTQCRTPRGLDPSIQSAAVVRQPRSPAASVLEVDGPLHAPQGAALRKAVRARLRQGDRTVVLSLARVSEVDAAGLGELVRAYNMTAAAAGALRIAQAPARVREILDRVGLLGILTAGI